MFLDDHVVGLVNVELDLAPRVAVGQSQLGLVRCTYKRKLMKDCMWIQPFMTFWIRNKTNWIFIDRAQNVKHLDI